MLKPNIPGRGFNSRRLHQKDITMDEKHLIDSLSQIFLRRIEQELDKMDETGVLVNEELLNAFSLLLKKEMHKYGHLPASLIDKAIDAAFNEIIKQRSIKH